MAAPPSAVRAILCIVTSPIHGRGEFSMRSTGVFKRDSVFAPRFFLSVARPPHPFGGGPNRARRLSGSERDLVVEVLHRWAALPAPCTAPPPPPPPPPVFLRPQ